jgi:hypothetical protein
MGTAKINVCEFGVKKHELRLYSHTLRRLFKLPQRKGTIVSANVVGSTVHIVFEEEFDNSIHHTITGGK